MLKKIVSLFIFSLMLFVSFDAMAFTLKKGTMSFGGGSAISFANRDSGSFSSADSVSVSFTSGYFIMDNLEIGGGLDLYYFNIADYESKGFSISPYATYHFDLNEVSNIYLAGMVGYGKYDRDSDYSSDDSDYISLSTEIGWEYFFNPSVSATVGARYKWEEEKDDDGWDMERNTFSTNIGFKFYF